MITKPDTPENRRLVGRTAQRMASGYYSYAVAQFVAANPLSENSLPPFEGGQGPTGEIARKDGTFHKVAMDWHLAQYREDMKLRAEVGRAWAAGTILTLGDELKAYGYFDHAPILEMVYHLRNGIAHGNVFNIDDNGRRRLQEHHAHNRDAKFTSPADTRFEILPTTAGRVLFDFMGGGDIIDLLQSVAWHLERPA